MIEKGFISNRDILEKMNAEKLSPRNIKTDAIKSPNFEEKKVDDIFKKEILKLSNSPKSKLNPRDNKVKSLNLENRKLKSDSSNLLIFPG